METKQTKLSLLLLSENTITIINSDKAEIKRDIELSLSCFLLFLIFENNISSLIQKIERREHVILCIWRRGAVNSNILYPILYLITFQLFFFRNIILCKEVVKRSTKFEIV